MELENGSRNSKSKPSGIVVDGGGGSKRSETPKIVDRSGRNSQTTTVLSEATANEDQLRASSAKLISFSSLSSVASDTSLEDFFQVDTTRTSNATPVVSHPKRYDYSSLDRGSTSRVSDVTHGSMRHGVSPTEFPSVQMMDRSGGGYDPYRIPSSVFSRSKSNKEMEWSLASNESLFSIHLENNSFSRDHIFFLGEQTSDLTKSGELFGLNPVPKSGELFGLNPPPPVPVVETESNRIEDVRQSVAGGVADETVKESPRTNAEHHSDGRVTPPAVHLKYSSLSHRSDGTGSTQSFAFPITSKRSWPLSYCSNCSSLAICSGTWPSCYCSNCSWAFRCCTWPSCHCPNCTWPSCHCPNCTWPSCYCSNCSPACCYPWKCSKNRICCDLSSTLADGVDHSVKYPEVACPESPAAALVLNKKLTKSKTTRWFCCCFSWCKWGCVFRRRCSWSSCSWPSCSCPSCSSRSCSCSCCGRC